MSKTTHHIDLLNKDNYDTWAIQAEAVLIKNKLWKYVEKTIADNASNDDIEGDRLAKSELILLIAPSQLKEIKKCTTAKSLWDKLKEIHASKGPARKATLLKQLIHTKLEGDNVREHLNRFMDIVDKLADMEVPINDDLLTIMMLYSLSPEFENFRVAIESRDTLPKPADLKTKILEESEARHQTQTEPTSSQALQVTQNAKKCQVCKNKNVYFKKNSHKICTKCWSNQNKKKKASPQNETSNHVEEVSLLSVQPAFTNCNWVLDSGCTSHMTYAREHFTTLKADSSKLSFASKDQSTVIKGRGTVKVVTNEYGTVNLLETLYVPTLTTNLLSVAKITQNGGTVTFTGKKATVTLNNKTLMTAEKENNLYYVKTQIKHGCTVTPETNMVTIQENSIGDWHRKLGHMNGKDLYLALKNETLIGLNFKKDEVLSDCEACIQAKMTQVPSPNPRTTPRTTQRLEIVHSDVCGPIKTPSLGGNRYFVTFIDEHSRYGRVYFLKHKTEVFQKFKEFKEEMENFTGNKIKFLQTDNGTEYINKDFLNYLKAKGIAQRLTAPYTPHQNGLAERKNRTLVEKARAMLIDSKAPMHLWAEAVNTANYLANRSINSAIGNQTPFERWVLRKPCVNHLHPFGSKAFVLKKGPKGHKFAPKATPGVFIGYSEISKAYKIYIPTQRKTVISKDVKILKTNFYETTSSNVLNNNNDTISQEQSPTSQMETIELEFENTEENTTESHLNDSVYEESLEQVDEIETTSSGNENVDILQQDEVNIDEPENVEPIPNQRCLRDRSSIRMPQRYDDFVLAAADEVNKLGEPTSYKEALSSPDKDKWLDAMLSEISSLNENETWELVKLPKGRKALPSKWVYKIKMNPDGTVERYKARLVIKGFSQTPGVDYDKTFSPVARLNTIRALLATSVKQNLRLLQFDVTTAFLNGKVEEQIFMKQPEGYNDGTDRVCLLKRSLYGLKQAPRCWNICINDFLLQSGFKQSEADPCLYTRVRGTKKVHIALYVDDGLVASNNIEAEAEFISELNKRLKIRTSPATYFLGMEICKVDNKITLCQTSYTKKLLQKFNMGNCKSAPTPIIKENMGGGEEQGTQADPTFPYRQAVGALTYLSVGSRPDIAYALSVASRNLEKPTAKDVLLVKRIFRYLKGTTDKGLIYERTENDQPKLTCFSDADLAGDQLTGRSTTGMVCLLAGAAISWRSQRQGIVSLSSTEAETVAASETAQEILWLSSLLKSLQNLEKPILYLDNESAIKLSHNPKYEYHRRTKHIKLKHLFVRECVTNGELEVKQVPSERQLADMLTKPLFGPRLEILSGQIGLKRISNS